MIEVYLPDEIVFEIFQFFVESLLDILVLETTCKQYRRVLVKFPIWEVFFRRRYGDLEVNSPKNPSEKNAFFKKFYRDQVKIDMNQNPLSLEGTSSTTNFAEYLFSLTRQGWGRVLRQFLSRTRKENWFRDHFSMFVSTKRCWQYSVFKRRFIVFPGDQPVIELINTDGDDKEIVEFNNVYVLCTIIPKKEGTVRKLHPIGGFYSMNFEMTVLDSEYFLLRKKVEIEENSEIEEKPGVMSEEVATTKFLTIVNNKIRGFVLDGFLSRRNDNFLETVIAYILGITESGASHTLFITYSRLLELRNLAFAEECGNPKILCEDEIISYVLTKSCDRLGWIEPENRNDYTWSSITSANVTKQYFKKRVLDANQDDSNFFRRSRHEKPRITVRKSVGKDDDQWNTLIEQDEHNNHTKEILDEVRNRTMFDRKVIVLTKRSRSGFIGARNDQIHEVRLLVTENKIILQKNLIFKCTKRGMAMS